jgi:hypothetical protein
MSDPVRPDSDVMDANGNVTPRWNSWLSWVDTFVSNGRSRGTTAQRPTKNVYIGQFYYDETLGYPVWVDSVGPIVWHNAAGAAV